MGKQASKPLFESKAAARAWKERWELVNAIERTERRDTPIVVKLQHGASMLPYGRRVPEAPGVEEVRRRWMVLKSNGRS